MYGIDPKADFLHAPESKPLGADRRKRDEILQCYQWLAPGTAPIFVIGANNSSDATVMKISPITEEHNNTASIQEMASTYEDCPVTP